jgi:hypothetical protein
MGLYTVTLGMTGPLQFVPCAKGKLPWKIGYHHNTGTKLLPMVPPDMSMDAWYIADVRCFIP